jgi:hypothetical protein
MAPALTYLLLASLLPLYGIVVAARLGWPADLSVYRGREMGARRARVWTRRRRSPFAPGPTKNSEYLFGAPSGLEASDDPALQCREC